MLRTVLVTTLLLIAGAAHAGEKTTLRVAKVVLTDLDLSTEAGARKLVSRLRVAADEVCVELHTPVLPGESGRADRCRREAMAAAVERLNRPRVTLAYAAELQAGAN